MKLTVVSVSETGFHIDQLRAEAKLREIEFNQLNFSSFADFEQKFDQIGDVVLWRSSDLDIGISRTLAMNLISKKSHIINLGVGKYPFVTNKIFQQKMINSYLDYAAIPTFTFSDENGLHSAIDSGVLKFPFIQKPNLGARGVDVRLINSHKDLEENLKPVKNYVYQNFVKNNGDYRAFVLGGKILGVMKRVAKEGSILNNVSRGATAVVEKDVNIIKSVREIALRVASLFELQMCGVDIIYDTENDKYHFLEVNSVPQWQGFSSSTGINVAAEIVDYCIRLCDKKSTVFDKVKGYFDHNYPYLGAQKFHYASRLYLWTKDMAYKQKLDVLQKDLYSHEDDILENRIKRSLFQEPVYKTDKISAKRRARREMKEKYPKLKKFSEVFAMHFFAMTLYDMDITELVEKYINDDEALTLCQAVLSDQRAIAKASTTVINFLYFAKAYFSHKKTQLEIDPQEFLNIAQNELGSEYANLDQKIYLLTHTIIGESKMYTQNVELSEPIEKILVELEKDLEMNYGRLTLDMKLEFLVCCKLCNVKSKLEKVIISEAENSLSSVGNFIVDQGNNYNHFSANLNAAEHRNVLYLMSKLPRQI